MPAEELEWKLNFDKIKERFTAFYDRELIDRALVQVWAPRKGKEDIARLYGNKYGIFRSYKTIREWKEKNPGYDFLIDDRKEILSSFYYGGDAFPIFFTDFGPGSLAAYLGCHAEFRDTTIWFGPPVMDDYSSASNLRLLEDNHIWELTKGLTRAASKASGGDYFVTIANLTMNLDVAASLRGSQNLLIDMIESPKEVKALVDRITDIFLDCHLRLMDLVKGEQEFSLGWIPAYCKGCNYPIQSDFSAMISPRMFEEFVVDDLIKIARNLNRSIYHLDGPDAVRHLDIILDIPEIDVLQWVPGDGAPPAVKWIPMLKRIQKKGKGLIVYAENPGEVEELMMELDPKGLLISILADSEEQATDIVKKVEKLTVNKTI